MQFGADWSNGQIATCNPRAPGGPQGALGGTSGPWCGYSDGRPLTSVCVKLNGIVLSEFAVCLQWSIIADAWSIFPEHIKVT